MVRAAIVLHNIEVLDFEKLSVLFSDLLRNVRLDSSSELNIILLDNLESSDDLDSILGKLYSITRDVLILQNLHMAPINILFGHYSLQALSLDWLFVPEEKYSKLFIHLNFATFTQPTLNCSSGDKGSISDQNKYAVSALGGTFDHLHDGHKILLSVASFLTSERLIVGVTDQDLLLNKKFKEYLESFEIRCQSVQRFLSLLKPALRVEIVPIKDVCGPTGKVPEIECLIVSRETVSGGDFVNKTRIEKGLPRLDICVVNVLGGNEDDGWKEKLSSTELRKMVMDHGS